MPRALRRLMWPAGILIGLLAALSLSVFPARTLLGQQASISSSQAELEELDAQVAALEERVAALDTPEEIERLARERYNMVRPGEEAYGVLPMPVQPLDIPPGWPFTPAPPVAD